MELAKVFLRDTPEEKRLFELLRSAYVEARYNDDFVVTKEDIDALMPKVELLRDVVEQLSKIRFTTSGQSGKNHLCRLLLPNKVWPRCPHYCGKHTN